MKKENTKMMRMMNITHTASKRTGCRPLAENVILPKEAVFANLLQKLPKGEEGIREVQVHLFVPEERKAQLKEEFDIAFSENPEAFLVITEEDCLSIYSESKLGILYGIYFLIETATEEGVECGFFYDTPKTSYRGLKLYMPGPSEKDIQEFKGIIDMACCYRHNSIMLEVGGAMEYKRHPEINTAWIEYCNEMKRYPQRAVEVQTSYPWEKNSIHFENGDGNYLSQEQVRELVDYMKEKGMEVIPEVPLLSHCDYLMNAFPHLAERAEDPFPDTYCPNHPDVYPIVFDILDEVIDVFHPTVINIGHDEFYNFCLCDRCKDKDPAQLFADDIRKIHDYLEKYQIETMIWSEKLINAIDKKGFSYGGAQREFNYENGTKLQIPATYPAIDLIPKDVWCHHWYWELREEFEQEFLKRDMKVSFGNFSGQKIPHWKERVEQGVIGGCASGWTHARFDNFQRNGILFDLVMSCYLNWGPVYTDDQWEEMLPLWFEELYHYHYRKLLKKPHLVLKHQTTVERPWTYLTSLFVEETPIGHYHIVYGNGKEMDVPLYYGIQITNRDRFWTHTLDEAFDIFLLDNLLMEATYTTLPEKCANGTTAFLMPVEDPFPEEPIVSVSIVKETEEAGEIFLLGMERCCGTVEKKLEVDSTAEAKKNEAKKACIDG